MSNQSKISVATLGFEKLYETPDVVTGAYEYSYESMISIDELSVKCVGTLDFDESSEDALALIKSSYIDERRITLNKEEKRRICREIEESFIDALKIQQNNA